ncbi:hypothetical protein [Streptomyces sp. NBC_01176]|uniref:hypothetical protein n=1 Tax=Streptomyces sp. NBC_01176 TaxID=2903760 RepID=UPI002F9094F9|nr:hypothetical protein OG199_43755 [Streptomyces sp. NBC_01176]
MDLHLHIAPENLLIVVISCCIGYRVYRRPTADANAQLRQQGDLAGGVAAAAAAILILAFLLSLGDGTGSKSENGLHPAPTVHETRIGESVPSSVEQPGVRGLGHSEE